MINDTGAYPGDIFILASGSVRLWCVSDDGHEITISTHGVGDVFAFPSTQDEDALGFAASATEDVTTVYAFSAARFIELMRSQPDTMLKALSLLWDRYVALTRKYAESASHDVAGRLALELARRADASVDHTVHETHQDLAWLVNSTRQTVTSELGRLRDQGLISYRVHGHGIYVPDPERLRSEIVNHLPN